uniref:Uncharacterized protein n=1 Tax=uncultured marine group II/III euryarchaeote KM3_102_D05 TaxID=1457845 RepID=A0A075GAN4_9EURY|nr:hypothetical protein [uncultured marine group II/III euryarchaeote KM3_102_D05]
MRKKSPIRITRNGGKTKSLTQLEFRIITQLVEVPPRGAGDHLQIGRKVERIQYISTQISTLISNYFNSVGGND